MKFTLEIELGNDVMQTGGIEMKYAFEHKPGHSAYDHFAGEIISLAASEQRTTKIGMENALSRAWIAIRPHPATAPRIDVVRA